jgi:hypothetical protein
MIVCTTKTLVMMENRIRVPTAHRKTGTCHSLRFSAVMPVDIMFPGSGGDACVCKIAMSIFGCSYI